MYVDKPMRGHGLMQAIARVNRVFREKPGGLVVDYLGLAHELKQALATYTESGGTGETAIDQEEAVAVMLEKYEICCGLFHGFDWSKWKAGKPEERLSVLPAAQEHILRPELEKGKDRLMEVVRDLSRAFALAVPHEEALRIRDDVAFFQAVRAVLSKHAPGETKTQEELDLAVRQIVSRAVASEGVMDIFAAAGLQKPDISILSDEFLAEVRGMPQKKSSRGVAAKAAQRRDPNEAQEKCRSSEVVRRDARTVDPQVPEPRHRSRASDRRNDRARQGHAPGKRARRDAEADDEELAFYDALETNDSAVQVLGDETLRTIAREVTDAVRKNVTIDWTMRENVRAQLRVIIKRILRKYGYPPDKQEKATQTVLEQVELLGWEVAA